MLPYTPDAEDACQEALLNIATKIGSWDGRGRFTTWMHVVAVNSARTTYRRMKNQAVAADPLASTARSDRPDPRTTSVIAGTRLDLLEAMESLEREHPQYVEPLLLRDVYGMSYDEIAQQVGRPARHRQGPDPPRPHAGPAAAPGAADEPAAARPPLEPWRSRRCSPAVSDGRTARGRAPVGRSRPPVASTTTRARRRAAGRPRPGAQRAP